MKIYSTFLLVLPVIGIGFFSAPKISYGFCQNIQTVTQEICCSMDFIDTSVNYFGIEFNELFSTHQDVEVGVQSFEARLDRVRSFCDFSALLAQVIDATSTPTEESGEEFLIEIDQEIVIPEEEEIVSPLEDFTTPELPPSPPVLNELGGLFQANEATLVQNNRMYTQDNIASVGSAAEDVQSSNFLNRITTYIHTIFENIRNF